MKTSIKASIKLDAQQRFLQGNTLEEIAKTLDLKQKTVSQWCYRYNWIAKRAELFNDVQRTLYREMTDKICISAQKYLDCSILIAEIALRELQAINEDSKSGNGINIDKLFKLASLLARGSLIHKNVVPEADEEILKTILQELNHLNLGPGCIR